MKRFFLILVAILLLSGLSYASIEELILADSRGEFYLAGKPEIQTFSKGTIVRVRVNFYWNENSKNYEYEKLKDLDILKANKCLQYYKSTHHISFTFYNDGEIWFRMLKVTDYDKDGVMIDGYINYSQKAEKVIENTEIWGISEGIRGFI